MFPMGTFHVMLSTLIPAQYTFERIWSGMNKDTWFYVCDVFKRSSWESQMATDNFLQNLFSVADSFDLINEKRTSEKRKEIEATFCKKKFK